MNFIPRHKFRSQITEVDGIKFRSKKEAHYYKQLRMLQRNGDVIFFLRQVPFYLAGDTKYVCDFVEFRKDGTVHFIDVKGFRTPQYIEKKKMVEATYPVIIEEK